MSSSNYANIELRAGWSRQPGHGCLCSGNPINGHCWPCLSLLSNSMLRSAQPQLLTLLLPGSGRCCSAPKALIPKPHPTVQQVMIYSGHALHHAQGLWVFITYPCLKEQPSPSLLNYLWPKDHVYVNPTFNYSLYS